MMDRGGPRVPFARVHPVTALLGLVALVIAGIFVSVNSTRSPAPNPPSSTTVKRVVQGLMDRSHIPTRAWIGHVNAWVVNAAWADLQPKAGGPISANNDIDKAVALVGTEAGLGFHLTLKVRIAAGTNSPEWAKNIGGVPFKITDPNSGASGTVGRFWLPAFGLAFADLQTKLAAKYDAVPAIREVTVGRCTTMYSEPMIRNMKDPATIAALLRAKYTVGADHLCQQQAVDSMKPWTTTHVDLAFNPYQAIASNGSVSTDGAFTVSMMTYCLATLGARCVLENNSLRDSGISNEYDAMYASIKLLGAPISFQTATLQRLGSLLATLDLAVAYGANSVELPDGYQSSPVTIYDHAAANLTGNPTGSGGHRSPVG